MAIQPSTLLRINKEISLIITGFLVFLLFCVFLILSIPCYLYRFFISKILAPLYFGGSENGKVIPVNANAASLDALETKRSPRFNMAVHCVIDDHVSYIDFYQKLQEKWINQKDQSGHLKYPELQMFMEKWMGYMCYKRDENFNLKNHLKQITLDKNGSSLDSENFYLEFIENLINKNWKQKQSPWKVYLVHNYKNAGLGTKNRNLTLVAFCFHHSMTDGFGLLYLFAEQLFGNKLDPLLAKPSVKKKNVCTLLSFPIQVLSALGQLIFWKRKEKTIYHIPDNKKYWRQIFRKAPLIPINKVKVIKNKFGVSFASVLNSACSLALGKMMANLEKKRGSPKPKLPENILMVFVLPKSNHPKILTNHALGAALEAPISLQMSSIERLRACEKQAKKVVVSPIPMLSELFMTVCNAHPTSVAKLLVNNRTFATGFTNFPGPDATITWNGGPKMIAAGCPVGGFPGVAGVGFMVCSYVDNIQICATAEKAVFSHDELQELLDLVS